MYGEETDYCYRLKKLGISSFVVPESVVVHKGAESLKNSKHLESYYRRRNLLYFEKEHYGVSILKNLSKRAGLTQIIKFFVKNLFVNSEKNELYYLNIANIHALIGINGKLKF
jgi:GT2 family glycosyltransferase